MAFMAIGAAGLLLALVYPLLVKEERLSGEAEGERKRVQLTNVGALFSGRALKCAYVGSGLQLFVAGALPAWLPTYFVRYYDLPLKQATSLAAVFLALGGAGMIVCGMISDKLVRETRQRAVLSAFYCMCCAAAISVAFAIGPGSAQLVLLGIGMFLATASAGPSGAIVAALTPAALHGTAFAVLTLANNAFGVAPVPIVTGWFAALLGVLVAFQLLPIASAVAALVFVIGTLASRIAFGTSEAA